MFVPKKNKSRRLCVDYCQLNTVTVRGGYPILRTGECVGSVGEAMLFPILDASSEHRQIKMDEKNLHKTTVVAQNGLYKKKKPPPD